MLSVPPSGAQGLAVVAGHAILQGSSAILPGEGEKP
jgi:hypothetical protein